MPYVLAESGRRLREWAKRPENGRVNRTFFDNLSRVSCTLGSPAHLSLQLAASSRFHDEFLFNDHCHRKRDTSCAPVSTATTEWLSVGSKMLVAVTVATSQRGRRTLHGGAGPVCQSGDAAITSTRWSAGVTGWWIR